MNARIVGFVAFNVEPKPNSKLVKRVYVQKPLTVKIAPVLMRAYTLKSVQLSK